MVWGFRVLGFRMRGLRAGHWVWGFKGLGFTGLVSRVKRTQ